MPPCNANQTNALEIVIYVPLCLSDGKIGLINTLNHELIHAYVNCKRGGIKDCQSYWYGEIRGSYFGQCAQNKSEKARKECAIRGAKKSIKKGLASMQKKSQKSR